MTTFSPARLLDAVTPSRQPHLTAYTGPDGADRVELSGHVLANWVSKTANFLDEEGVGGGDVVAIDLPAHWRAVVWVWAAWLRGASVSFVPESAAPASSIPHDGAAGGGTSDGGTSGGGASDGAMSNKSATDNAAGPAVVVTDRPDRHAHRGDNALVVALPLEPLALRWEGDLPAGALDGGEVMGQADVLVAHEAADGEARAVVDSGLSFEDLGAAIGRGDGSRIAFVPSSVWVLVRTVFSVWRGGGSVVVLGQSIGPARREKILAQEGARFVV